MTHPLRIVTGSFWRVWSAELDGTKSCAYRPTGVVHMEEILLVRSSARFPVGLTAYLPVIRVSIKRLVQLWAGDVIVVLKNPSEQHHRVLPENG